MSDQKTINKKDPVVRIEDSKVIQFLFGDVRLSWLWAVLRVYLGWQWLEAGWGKVNNPVWFGPEAGAAVTGFLNGALAKTAGEHPDVQGWYAWFIQNVALPNAKLFSHLVSLGELLVGIALILGIFTGIAAFFGLFMNFNYLFAGTVSTNPLMVLIALVLILAWKTAGWLGLDHWLLPALGTPWAPGKVFRKEPGRN